MQPSYPTVVGNLRKASVPIRELGAQGKVAVSGEVDDQMTNTWRVCTDAPGATELTRG